MGPVGSAAERLQLSLYFYQDGTSDLESETQCSHLWVESAPRMD